MKRYLEILLVTGVVCTPSACATGEALYRSTPARTARALPLGSVARSPRDVYAVQLERDRVEAARAWEEASRRALRAGLVIQPSFRERIRFPAAEPHAVAYRFTLRRGQSLDIRIDPIVAHGDLFADVFEVVAGADLFRHVQAPRGTSSFDFRARADGEYVLRLQPALGNAGTYEVTVVAGKTLLFPVDGVGTDAIRSYFGDPRDGGARSHEGVDIFAPRGTPVHAVVDGYITSTTPTPVGGNVVWMRDESGNLEYYFAHLDRSNVRDGQRVTAGDLIGTVGNTGNARTVSPHLHFAIYQPGRIALDPAPLLYGAGTTAGSADLVDLAINPSWLGRWARVNTRRVPLRGSPTAEGAVITQLSVATPLFLLGGVAGWHRVVLADGTSGFLASRDMELSSSDGR